jgi:PAS domain S-box-containing protein
MDSISDVLFIKDMKSRILLINRAYEKIFGVTPDEVPGKTISSCTKIRDSGAYIGKRRRVKETGQPFLLRGNGHDEDGDKTFLISRVPWRSRAGR